MIGVRGFARRVALPTAAAWLGSTRIEGAVRHRVRRITGRRARAELFLALDDPYSILALEVAQRVRQTRALDIDIFLVGPGHRPVGTADARKRYAVLDAARLSALRGQPFARTTPLDADSCASLSAIVETARDRGRFDTLVELVLERIWRGGREVPDFGEVYALYHRAVGDKPPADMSKARGRLASHVQRMHERGPWDSSSLWFEGGWFFAHERAQQILEATRELRS